MNSIFEVLERLGPVQEVQIGTMTRNPALHHPLEGAQHSMQLAFRWLKGANDELLVGTGGGTDLEQNEVQERAGVIKPPTLLGTDEQLQYIKDQLFYITKDIKEYVSTVSLPPEVQYKVERGYDRLVEALFDTATATIYYNVLKQQDGRNRG